MNEAGWSKEQSNATVFQSGPIKTAPTVFFVYENRIDRPFVSTKQNTK